MILEDNYCIYRGGQKILLSPKMSYKDNNYMTTFENQLTKYGFRFDSVAVVKERMA